ncbi:hypothetical protein [Nocardioides panacisoli]|uniref:ApeA N-terminal domain-containing protein n=1 Tax=Nocardioides panacisoli TaxID=627624 RepID=A0ABP7IT34_9ACTN
MFSDSLPMLRKGVVGTFQPVTDPPGEYFDGHLQLGPEGVVIAVVAGTERDRDATWVDDPANCRILYGITEAGTVLAPVGPGVPSTTRGDVSVRVARWHSSNLLIDPPFKEIDDDTVTQVTLSYLGLGSWSGRPAHVDEPFNEDGVRGWRIEVRAEPVRSVTISDEFDLTIQHSWARASTSDRLSLDRPLIVGFRSNTRQPLAEHIVRLDAVHALLSIAHWQPVSAASGKARLDPSSRKRAKLWDHTMINDLVEPDPNEFPIFTLADINDLDGLAAWVIICLTKPRAVTPIIKHRLFQNQTPESRMLSTAAALEYWKASNARNAAASWAKKVSEYEVPAAVGRSVSIAWNTWIGDADHWAQLFYGTYVQLKHRTDEPDVGVVEALEYSGRWLLTASILDQCADSSAPSDRIFSGHGLRYPVPDRIREVLDHAPIPPTAHR